MLAARRRRSAAGRIEEPIVLASSRKRTVGEAWRRPRRATMAVGTACSRRAASRSPWAPRGACAVARTLDRLASAAEQGAARHRRTRPPPSVLEVAPEACRIRELAALLREHERPPEALVAACDRFADGCWNAALRRLDREYHRRELGRLRYLLLC